MEIGGQQFETGSYILSKCIDNLWTGKEYLRLNVALNPIFEFIRKILVVSIINVSV